jgi:hypothetical protein
VKRIPGDDLRKNLVGLTRDSLYDIAKKLHVPGFWRQRRSELIHNILAKYSGDRIRDALQVGRRDKFHNIVFGGQVIGAIAVIVLLYGHFLKPYADREKIDCSQNWGILASGDLGRFHHHVVYLQNAGRVDMENVQVRIGPTGEEVKENCDELINILPSHLRFSCRKEEPYIYLSIDQKLPPRQPVFIRFKYPYNQIEYFSTLPNIDQVNTSKGVYESCGEPPKNWGRIRVSGMEAPLLGNEIVRLSIKE